MISFQGEFIISLERLKKLAAGMGRVFERMRDVVCGAGVVRLRQGFGVTASAFYGATPHKKIQLGSPKGLSSRSFFLRKNRGWSIGNSNPPSLPRGVYENLGAFID